MRRKQIQSQIGNYDTYNMYLRQLTTLAQNVFTFKNLPEIIDEAFMNRTLLFEGQIAFFKDDILGVLALPFSTIGKLDIYGNPTTIAVRGQNGYYKALKKSEYIIMYDNNGRYPLITDVKQYAERIAQDTRVSDINIAQQKTPRFWKVPKNKEMSVKDLVNNVDSFENTVLTYNDLSLDDIDLILSPAPFVADKVDEHKDKEWNEFLRLIGVANLQYQKKERNISDEINMMQGGTIASRYTRFDSREKAINEINKKWNLNVEVGYYDGIPTTEKEDDYNDEYDDSMDDSNVTN